MKPTIGRIVIYNTTKEDRMTMGMLGCNVQKQLPAIIVAVWSDHCVNLKVILDGPIDLWKTSVNKQNVEFPSEFSWEFPAIIKEEEPKFLPE